MVTLIFSIVLIVTGILTGIGIKSFLSPRPGGQGVILGLQKWLTRIALLGLNPVAFIGSIWQLQLNNSGFFGVPFIGLGVLGLSFIIGLYVSHRAFPNLPFRQITFATSMSFTNIGNLGGVLVFIILGEEAFGIIPFYKLFEELWYYGFLFTYARVSSENHRQGNTSEVRPRQTPLSTALEGIRKALKNEILIVLLSAIALGIGLNKSGIPRPQLYSQMNSVLIPLSSFVLLVSVGLGMQLSATTRLWKPALLLVGLRHLLMPLLVGGLGLALGLQHSGIPQLLPTVILLSAMPMAFVSLIPIQLYDLDNEFGSTAWLFSMLSLLVTTPVFMFFFSRV